ncbi:MAG: hypothetical protein WAN22_24415 [Solirubrobacteraceae bacterium]
MVSLIQSQIGHLPCKPFREPGQGPQFGLGEMLERRLDGPLASGDDPPSGRAAGGSQAERHRAPVFGAALAGHVTVGNQAVDQTHRR